MTIGAQATIWIVVLAALWLGLAVAVAIVAARRLRLAESVLDTARHQAALLASAPARPAAVARDGSLSADPSLLRDLGLSAAPRRIADLCADDAGIRVEDAKALQASVDTARETALPFVAKVRVVPSALSGDGPLVGAAALVHRSAHVS